MYNLNTGQARTDLYGIDKGEAQVFDNKDYMAREERGAKFEQAKALQKQKQAADRQDETLKELSKLGSYKLKEGDMPGAAKDTQDIRDMTFNAMDVNGNMSNQDYLNIWTKANELKTKYELSQAARTQAFQESQKYQANPGKYFEKDVEALKAWQKRPGEYSSIPSLREKVNVVEDIQKSGDFLKDQLTNMGYGTHYAGQTIKLPNGQSYTVPTREQVVRGRMDDKQVYDTVEEEFIRDMGVAPKGKDEVIAYAEKKYAPFLMALAEKERPASTNINVGGVNPKLPDFVYDPEEGIAKITPPADKKDVVNEVVVGGKTLKYKTPNPRFDSKGNLVGGEYIQTPTTEQQKDNKRYIDIQETLRDNEIDNADTEKEIQAIYDKYDPIIAKVPYPEKVIQTNDKNEIDKLIKIAYGVKAEDIMKGNKSGVNYVEASKNKPKTIGGKTYNSFLEYYEANKSNKQKITLRDEWNRGGEVKTTELSDKDQQALDWANANPKDPRAIAIKKRLNK